jgi:putative tricarboxylic transport membrane protein
LSPVLDGFAVVLEPTNLLYCLIGVVIGMLIGVLPGLGPAATIAILLPLTFGLEPVTAIIMLAGIFYGAQYGGTVTSVLLRLPGEASSVVTVFDGNALARQGKAGTALGIAAIGSFVGGTLSIIALTLVAPLVARFALDFGPPEYTALALLGILLVATVSNGGRLKALIAAAVGLLLATVGRDDFVSAERFTLGNLSLADGLDFVPSATCPSPTASTSSRSRWACSASARSSTTSRKATAPRRPRPPSPTSGPAAPTFASPVARSAVAP